jgi:hypothetical protein
MHTNSRYALIRNTKFFVNIEKNVVVKESNNAMGFFVDSNKSKQHQSISFENLTIIVIFIIIIMHEVRIYMLYNYYYFFY